MDTDPITNSITKEIAALVSEAQKRAGVNVSQLVEGIGTPRTSLKRKLAGQTMFTINELISIGHFLDVPLQDLLPTPLFQAAS